MVFCKWTRAQLVHMKLEVWNLTIGRPGCGLFQRISLSNSFAPKEVSQGHPRTNLSAWPHSLLAAPSHSRPWKKVSASAIAFALPLLQQLTQIYVSQNLFVSVEVSGISSRVSTQIRFEFGENKHGRPKCKLSHPKGKDFFFKRGRENLPGDTIRTRLSRCNSCRRRRGSLGVNICSSAIPCMLLLRSKTPNVAIN